MTRAKPQKRSGKGGYNATDGNEPYREELSNGDSALREFQEHLTREANQGIGMSLRRHNSQASASASIKKAAYKSVSASVDERSVKLECSQLLSGIRHPSLKTFVNKLKIICNDLTKECGSVDELKKTLSTGYDTGGHINLYDLEPGYELRDIYNRINEKSNNLRKTIFLGQLNDYNVTYIEQIGVGSGVTRTMVQGIIDNIKNELFIPTEEDSIRYVINPAINIKTLKEKGYNVADEDDVDDVYRLVGRFFAFCIRNDIPTDMYLSRGVLARLIYKDSEIEPDEYVMYYLLDMAQIGTSMINMMRDAANIEYIGLNFNDEFPLVKTNEDVSITVDNFKDYLRLKARHQLTRQIGEGKRDTSRQLQALVEGFYIRQKLRRSNATVKQLEKLMSGLIITEETIRNWLKRDKVLIISETQQSAQVGVWLKEILNDFGRSFPIEVFEEQNSASKNITFTRKKQLFVEFFTKLMYFWTGIRKLDPTRTYEVRFEKDNRMPRAATCFYRLRLPMYVPSKEELYRKLVQAAFFVEIGVGLKGGKKPTTKPTRHR